MTASERLTYLSGLSGVSAATHWLTLGSGSTAGAILVAFSGLSSATAGVHLMTDATPPVGGTGTAWVRLKARRRRC